MSERQMTRLQLLQEVSQALNMIRRTPYHGGKYKDTYQLAAEVDRHVTWAGENKEDGDR